MPADDNVALVHRYYDEIWNTGTSAVIDELLAPSFVFYPPDAPEGLQGRATHRDYVAWHRRAFPDQQLIVIDTLADGEKVATHWIARGTHHGAYAGVPPGGQQITVRGMDLFRVVEGRIQEVHSFYDLLTVRRQLRAPAGGLAVRAPDETATATVPGPPLRARRDTPGTAAR